MSKRLIVAVALLVSSLVSATVGSGATALIGGLDSTAAAAKPGPFVEKNGIVVMEVESAGVAGAWKSETAQSGYTGSSYFSWRGANQYETPGNGTLSYPVLISSAGNYKVSVRARRDKEGRSPRDDEENDVWIRADGGSWKKIFHSTAWSTWGWAQKFDIDDVKSPAVFNLSKGVHTIQFSGRSANFKMDRIHLHTGANPPLSTAQSARKEGTVGKKKKKKKKTNVVRVWQTKTLTFTGPKSNELANARNPFLDFRLEVKFFSPRGKKYRVPGFFDGNGSGGSEGKKWRVHFTPDRPGRWKWKAAFRKGHQVAINQRRKAGKPAAFNGKEGSFKVRRRARKAPGFFRTGRLSYADKHYLKFEDGPYWIKTGADEPENLLAYSGFDGTTVGKFGIHHFSPHVTDWKTGNPDWGANQAKGIIGALNYLASARVNSIYFLTMNIGGDGQDTWPFAGTINRAGAASNDNLHYDVSKLRKWNIVFTHAQRKGIVLHVVLGEAERANKLELDNGTLGVERKLYYRELIARFGHHNAIQWNISEEYDHPSPALPLKAETVKGFAGYIGQIDPYNHPITVHNFGFDPDPAWRPFLGDRRFDLTSFQFAESDGGRGAAVEKWRTLTKKAGRPLPIGMDELAELNTSNMDAQRKNVLWPILLSGGHVEYYSAPHLNTENFRNYGRFWEWNWYARKFMEKHLPFWKMRPMDDKVSGASTSAGPVQVLGLPGKFYGIYLPNAQPAGQLDLKKHKGVFTLRWYNPRTGVFEGARTEIAGGGPAALGAPPSDPSSDWVLLVKRRGLGLPT